MRDDEDTPHGSQLLPLALFVLLVAALVAGVWLFPKVYAYMTQQDCIASGHTNCGPHVPPPQ